MDFFNTVNTQHITCWFCGKFIIINNHGGDMGQTYGVPVNEIVEGIKHGVRKVNETLILSALPAEPKASKRAAQISLIALVASFKNLRGSKLAVFSIKCLTMSQRYLSGELDAKIK
jgi:fructose-bisphosphate aldolase class II